MSHPTARARRLSSLGARRAVAASAPSAAAQTAHAAGKVPISTASAEAKADFIKGRTLAENLRAHESREFMRRAVAKDPDFAHGPPEPGQQRPHREGVLRAPRPRRRAGRTRCPPASGS